MISHKYTHTPCVYKILRENNHLVYTGSHRLQIVNVNANVVKPYGTYIRAKSRKVLPTASPLHPLSCYSGDRCPLINLEST
jgi:hypothetical protein